MELKGLIIKGIGGFYYVETEYGIYECRARGKFRKDQITPYAGDEVIISAEDDMTGYIIEVCERKNSLIRPQVANIDNLFIITSIKEPSPNIYLIDKTIAVAEIKGINPILVITKSDLSNDNEINKLKSIYDKAGIICIVVSNVDNTGIDKVECLLKGKKSAFTGNSGVGKSSLLNSIYGLSIRTDEISSKLGRGKHTTREVELYKLENGGYVADSAGFSTFDIQKYQILDKDEIIYGFREFLPYLGKCKFNSCTHICEQGCAVITALNNNEIAKSRFDSYTSMYNEIKDIKKWQINKNV